LNRLLNISLLLATLLLSATFAFGQSTSWTGAVSSNWSNAGNWTNGVPGATVDAIIGDANFTGSFDPNVDVNANCQNLTISGTNTPILSILKNKLLTVSGSVIVNAGGEIRFPAGNGNGQLTVAGNVTISGGTITQSVKSTITLSGNWTNSGTYSAGNNNAAVVFAGVTQTITGTTTFRKLTINAGSTTTISNAITARTLTVNGTFDPSSFLVTVTTALTVNAGGVLKVNTLNYSSNYSRNAAANAGSIIDYASASAQNITNSTTTGYSTLRISGGGVKTATANLLIAGTTATTGNLEVLAGTFDLSTFTANRTVTVAGGTLTVANGATLRFQTATFPTGYNAHVFGGTSTIDYSGAAQTVLLEPQNASSTTYGNLRLSGSSTKTMPASYMSIKGNFTMTGTVTAAAGGALRIDGNDSVGTNCFFSTAFDDTIGGNFINNGTFISTAHTVLTGPSAIISGSGINHFNDLTITGVGLTASTNTNLVVAGNFTTTGAGTFTHTGGGTGKDSLTGTGKTISGNGITFNNLIITGTISTTTTFSVLGDMKVPSGSFVNTGGDVDLEGNGYVLTGGGTITFYQLDVHGSYTTTATFTIKQDFAVTGSFSASSGLVTFDSATVFSGTANLYDVTVSSGKRLQLGGNAVLGIKNNFTIAGATLDVTTTIPNTVDYNGSGGQTVRSATYHHLNFSTGGTKTAEGSLTINGDVTIGSGATFDASSFTHYVYGNWVNNGTLSAGTSTIRFVGGVNTTISGTGGGTFNVMALNKDFSTNLITVNGNFTVATLHMTSGNINIPDTSKAVTITTARDSNGVIIGKIKWKPSTPFTTGTAYAFESPNNFVKFQSGGTRPDSITLIVVLEGPADFTPAATTITRTYFITAYGGSGYPVNLRLHYEDDELNGNDEPLMNVHRSVTPGVWVDSGKTSFDSDENWVEDSITTDITGRWTLQSKISRIIAWKGTVSSAWENSANWVWVAGTTVSNDPPDDTTFVTLGDSTFSNQPIINSAARVRTIKFGDTADVTLTINSGSLTVAGSTGNLLGVFDRNRTHTVAVGNQTLTVGGNIILSDGIDNHVINLTIGSGTVSVGGSITHSANSSITMGSGTLTIQRNWVRTGTASFTPGSGTVIYNGSGSQIVAGGSSGFSYNNLIIKKSAGIATLASYTVVNGNLTTDTLGTTGGTFTLGDSLKVVGNVNIKTGSTLRGGVRKLYVGGNWTRTGTFIADSVNVIFNGSAAQSIDSTIFNHLTIDKSGGSTATPTGTLVLNGNLTMSNGIFDLTTFSCDRIGLGGTMSMAAGAYLKIGNNNHHPNNFAVYSLDAASTTEYYGSGAQAIMGLSYGNLTLSNGGVNTKTLAGATTVKGDFSSMLG
jgi:fibronectin-binding autotransporter adhesin